MYSQCQHEANANVQPMPAQSVYTPKSCLPVAEHSAASALALPQFYCTQLSANCCCNRRINAAGYEQADRGAGGYMASFSSICLISDSPNSSTWNSCSWDAHGLLLTDIVQSGLVLNIACASSLELITIFFG